jgi:quercetin dioxygenase-like cupin family protein
MKLKDLHKEKKDIQTEILFKTNHPATAISIQIKKGKTLKKHVSKLPALLICVSGKALYLEDSKQVKLRKGKYVIITPNVIHEVFASKKSNFILIK